MTKKGENYPEDREILNLYESGEIASLQTVKIERQDKPTIKTVL